MSGTVTVTGFIVHSFVQPRSDGSSRLALLGRLDDGRTFAVVVEPFSPHYYLRRSDEAAAARLLPKAVRQSEFTTMDGEPVSRVDAASVADARRQAERLQAAGLRTYEADFPPADLLLMEHSVRGCAKITGAPSPGRHVDLVFINPELGPADWDPVLEILSLDIETNPETEEILAVSLVTTGAWGPAANEVLLVRAPNSSREPLGVDWITELDGEQALLAGLVGRIVDLDPDIITGWNVVDFDLAVISRRLARYGIPFAVARSDRPAQFLPVSRDESGRRQNAGVSCHGRQVIDGLRLLRYGPQRFADRKLDSVARLVLGEGKTVTAETSSAKIEALLALYKDDPVRFSDYCRTDAALVLRILEKTGLLTLTVTRSLLTGISLNRAWTSIPAFEFLYTEALHQRGMVAPTAGVDRLPQGEAPGGAILRPEPGLFSNVLVFDFKSLYPSIIQTFNIDPAGFIDVEDGYPEGADPPPVGDHITAPNGARFRREPGILPQLIARFWENRDRAKAGGDAVASYVYKIIMNSFYGVLGSPGCRFAGAPLAGAITGFGQYILHWTRDRMTGAGFRVLYGDTDSLFVLTGEEGQGAQAARGLFETGERLCRRINDALAGFVREKYGVASRLQLEFEQVYRRFYLPRIRHAFAADGEPGEARGRAKGYAGQVLQRSGEAGELDIKGMEAIRSDWTGAAGRLQTELLEMMFRDASPAEMESHIRSTVKRMQEGAMDAELVYARRLRKPVSSYTKSRPPHVQAALLLPPEEREGTIQYVMTTGGPQPVSHRTDALDHAHYLDRQLRPIAEPICEVLGMNPGDLFDPSNQLSLFTGTRRQ